MPELDDAIIVNALIRQALMSAQAVMGENGLQKILRSSGLEQFINNLPPDDLNPGILASEYAKLKGTHNEVGKEEIFLTMTTWLDAHLS
jgi:hypothetical protein